MLSATLSITVLAENTAGRGGLLGEHGLALWVERGRRRILFDTGQGLALSHNAERLRIDLCTANDVILSHGHYDHTGGLAAATAQLAGATVHAHRDVFVDRFSRSAAGEIRPVRSPVASFDWLRTRTRQVNPGGAEAVDLGDGVGLTGEIPRRSNIEDVGGAFYLDEACTQPDAIIDDQALFAQTSGGIVVLLGCAHAGVINTLDRVCELTGEDRIYAVIGGMHLLNADERRIQATICRLRELDVRHVGLAHCTGFAAMARLHEALPGRCFHCATGTQTVY